MALPLLSNKVTPTGTIYLAHQLLYLNFGASVRGILIQLPWILII